MKAEVIQGDNVEVMRTFPDECIDLTVTSPPYDNLRNYNGFSFDFENVAKELFRLTKQGGVVVWVVGDATVNGSETGTSFRQALYFKEIGFRLHDTMIYRKLNGAMGSHYTYLQEFEYMFVLSKGIPRAANLLRDRKNVEHGDRTTPLKKSDASGSLSERRILFRQEYGRRKNIWDYPVGGEKEGEHPAMFPEALAYDHIISWSNENDLILDPFCGSGTTGKMAVIAKRNFIGIDISAEYCELARARIMRAQGKPCDIPKRVGREIDTPLFNL